MYAVVSGVREKMPQHVFYEQLATLLIKQGSPISRTRHIHDVSDRPRSSTGIYLELCMEKRNGGGVVQHRCFTCKIKHRITVLTISIRMELASGSATVRQTVAALLIILLHFMKFR